MNSILLGLEGREEGTQKVEEAEIKLHMRPFQFAFLKKQNKTKQMCWL